MSEYPPFTMDPELARETREQLLRDGCAHPAISDPISRGCIDAARRLPLLTLLLLIPPLLPLLPLLP
eukprot:COSAG04_NODE_4947_length_1811_cov_1.839369_2_plen_66_part_01